jgi:hypothetical protein
MKMKSLVIPALLVMLSCCLISAGCAGNTNTATAIDYSKSSNWLSLPSQLDPVQNVDVFYVYPTEYFAGSAGPLIGEINDANMVAGAKNAFQKQATAFASVGNSYAPYYRQADAVYTLGLETIDDVYTFIGGIPATDVISAFDYYIKNYNNNRPFILVSHSQKREFRGRIPGDEFGDEFRTNSGDSILNSKGGQSAAFAVLGQKRKRPLTV